MNARDVMLTDEQWKKIKPLIPQAGPRPKAGRPRADHRMVFEGILWGLKNLSQLGTPDFAHEEAKGSSPPLLP